MTSDSNLEVYARAGHNEYPRPEWKARVDLAACHHLFDKKGWTDGINTHLSVRVPGRESNFFLKADHLMFHEVKASNLVEVDFSGNCVNGGVVNAAGAIIHGAVLEARTDINAVLHHHTEAGIAVSSQKEGLLPMSQHALAFYNRIGYHEYEGIALDSSEKKRLQSHLGQHYAMLLRNHGVLCCGMSVAGAFTACDSLEKACLSQLLAQRSNVSIHLPSEEVREHTASQYDGFGESRANELEWPALLRWLDSIGIRYAE